MTCSWHHFDARSQTWCSAMISLSLSLVAVRLETAQADSQVLTTRNCDLCISSTRSGCTVVSNFGQHIWKPRKIRQLRVQTGFQCCLKQKVFRLLRNMRALQRLNCHGSLSTPKIYASALLLLIRVGFWNAKRCYWLATGTLIWKLASLLHSDRLRVTADSAAFAALPLRRETQFHGF
jgi:hypothetical protein